jgi:hypothetical protein
MRSASTAPWSEGIRWVARSPPGTRSLVPRRVRELLLVGAAPLFPGTSVPGMLRLVSSPIGTLLGKLMKPSPKLVVKNMRAFGEGETITRQPELIDAQGGRRRRQDLRRHQHRGVEDHHLGLGVSQ